MSFKKPFLTLFLLQFLFTVSGQEGELQYYQNGFYIKQYSEVSGLVSNGCKNLYQDSRGFLWITTFKGLSRFDGKQFINYGINEGLPGSNITQVSEDSLGFIYVATTTGIARYTGYNKNADNFFYTYPQTTHLNGSIYGMQAIDSSTIIFQQNDGAVYLLKKNKLIRLSSGSSGCGNVIDRSGYNYFYAYIPDTIRIFDAHFKNIKNIFHKDSGYTAESPDIAEGFHIYAKGKKQRIKNATIIYQSTVPDSIIWFANLDTLNRMIYFKDDGIYYYNDTLSKKIFDLKSLSLSCGGITCVRDGTVWVTTNRGGLFRITPLAYTDGSVIEKKHYFYCEKNKPIISTKSRIYSSLFWSIDTSLAKKTEFILSDKKDDLWYCTINGIYKQSGSRQPEHYLFPGETSYWNEKANQVSGAVETTAGDVWFYGNCGLVLYKSGNFTHYTQRNGLTVHGNVRRMIIEGDGTVLLLDYSSHLKRVQGDTIIPVTKSDGVSHFIINDIKGDNNGFTWIEYNRKLYKIIKEKSGNYIVADSISHPPSWYTPEIKAFEFDKNGNCWIAYAGGNMQVYFSNRNGHYDYTNSITYTKDDGLAPLASTNYNLCPDDNGNMAAVQLTNNRKLLLFSIADALKRRALKPPVVSITGILINHKEKDWASAGYLTGPEGIPDRCKLSYEDNNIIFNYSGTSLSNPASVVYQTMLKGYDKEWQTTVITTASYTNLPAGNYTFMIKAANANREWSDVYKYNFTILPPWYKTWWAILLWTISVLLIIYLIFFIRLSSVRMSHLKESSLFKSDLIGLIGHDMVTPLLYIAKVSRQLRNYNGKLSKETTLDSLSEIDTTATKLHFFGESIVHWIKVQNNDFKPVVEKFHVYQTIKELADFHQPLAAEKGNGINYEMNEDLYCYQDPTLVRIILHNLLLNANKFTVRGKIIIAAIKENNRLIISVQDTGKGMDESKVNSLNRFQSIRSTPGTSKEKGWGMGYKVIIEMLKFTGGALLVNSRLNEGTEVIINLPCRESQLFPKGYSEFPHDIKEFRN